MTQKPLYTFKDTTELGIDEVPLSGTVMIEDSDGNGNPKFIVITLTTNFGPTTTIAQVLAGSDYADVGVNKSGDDTLTGKYIFSNGSDVSATTDGAITIGDVAALNMSLDGNEIMARTNGATSTLNLNIGGTTAISTLTVSGTDVVTNLNADKLDGIDSGSFLRSDSTDYLTSTIYLRGDLVGADDGYRDHGVFGNYDSTKTDHIWSMGTGYRNSSSGANFGNLYGLAYKHTNNGTGGTMASGHQMVWCANGTPKSAMGYNIWTSGNVTAYSDRRVKENLEVIPDALDRISKLNGYTYDRTDIVTNDIETEYRSLHNPNNRHVGLIAQELLKVLPEAVIGGPTDKEGTEDEHYSVSYGNVVALLIEGMKELQAEIEELKRVK